MTATTYRHVPLSRQPLTKQDKTQIAELRLCKKSDLPCSMESIGNFLAPALLFIAKHSVLLLTDPLPPPPPPMSSSYCQSPFP